MGSEGENDAADTETANNATLPTEPNKSFEDLCSPGFSDNVSVAKLMDLFDCITGDGPQSKSPRDFHQFGDGMSLKHFRGKMRELYIAPLVLMHFQAPTALANVMLTV